jgi:hypothetical protein
MMARDHAILLELFESLRVLHSEIAHLSQGKRVFSMIKSPKSNQQMQEPHSQITKPYSKGSL